MCLNYLLTSKKPTLEWARENWSLRERSETSWVTRKDKHTLFSTAVTVVELQALKNICKVILEAIYFTQCILPHRERGGFLRALLNTHAKEYARRVVASNVSALLPLCYILKILLTTDFTRASIKDLQALRYFARILVHLHNALMWALLEWEEKFCSLCGTAAEGCVANVSVSKFKHLFSTYSSTQTCIQNMISEFPQNQHPSSQHTLDFFLWMLLQKMLSALSSLNS